MATDQRNPNRDTWGRRCDLGCESWPDTLDFEKCLKCGEPTTRYSNLSVLDFDEAQRLLRIAKFNAYYARHCERLRIPTGGDLPDWFEAQQPPLDERLLRPSRPSLRPTKS